MKTSDTVLRKIYLSLYLKGLCVRGSWRPNRTATYWPPLLWPSAFLSRSPGMLNRGPGAQPLWVLVFSTASYRYSSDPQLSIGGLRGPPTGCWLSLPHLVTNWSGVQRNWLPVFTELYNSSMSTFLWASQIALLQPIHGQGYNILIDRMHLLFTKVYFLFWLPSRVLGQYTTLFFFLLSKMNGWVEYRRSKTAKLYTQGPRYGSLVNSFFFMVI